MNIPKLKQPSYKIISSVAMTNPKNSLILIDLGSTTTIKSISKGEAIATGSINSKSVEFKSLYDVAKESKEIYALIEGYNYTGIVSLTLKSGITSSSITITEEDCFNVCSLYYGQNFESLSSVSDFCKTETIVAEIKESDKYGKYIEANSSSNRSGTFYSLADLNVPKAGSYILEFDLAIGNTNTNTNSTFCILTDPSNSDSYLLKMDSYTYNNGNNDLTWYIGNSDTSATFTSDFVHFKLLVDRIDNKMGLSIYTLDDKIILEKQIINKSYSAKSDSANCFYMALSRGVRGTIKLNNISVYTYEKAQITPPFTKRKSSLSLGSILKLILSVNKSIYCSASFKDTEITLESLKPGKAYMYFEGILEKNDNKALALIIINIDERGSITFDENINVFSTNPTFNKVPSTIQKQYQTYSSIDGIDTSEPNDNTSITPSVNVNEINSKFSLFDSENSIKPRAKIAFNITNEKWSILYTKDNIINEYSEYILYEESYDGLLDCINASFNFLTSERTSKEKISIITSGSTGTPLNNKNSVVNSANRMKSSISINCKSYVIIDFEDNYIYIDNSQPYTKDSGEKYSIQCFIDIEKYLHDITICNLNLMGMHTYGIFLSGSYDVLFKNINITVAQGENYSSSIGMRIQSQENAIANVALNKWAHDIYIDNCSFNGLSEHGIETFNVYNIYGTTIKITDSGGCGILFNCSYNAWVNSVYGIRCCASGTYAAVRFANDAGPNINIHYVYGEACGNGVFLVSSSNDITIDKINLVNIHATPVYLGGSAGLHIQSGKINSNGGEIKSVNYKGEVEINNATTGGAIFLVNGSSSQFLPQWNSIFENIKIEGFTYGYTERYNMSSNYNIYNNIDTKGCTYASSAPNNGTGTEEDVGFGFCVIDGIKGPGNEKITGEVIKSGDYSYALNSDSSSYIIIEYFGSESVVITPKKFNGKPVSRIGSFAFYNQKNLLSITITENIKSLGGLSFGNCKALKIVKFLSGGEYEIGHCAFRGCDKLKDVDLTDVKILRASCFAWCPSLEKIVCPKSVVYFGSNCFYRDNIDLTIQCDNISLMTVEPYAFYFIGFNSKINFTGVSQPTDVVGVPATGNNSYYYNSQSFVERNFYKPGVWCKYYYHVAVTPTFK